MKQSFKKLFKDYFDFSRGERNAFILLVALSIIISIYPIIGFKNNNPVQTDFSLIQNLEAFSKSDSSKKSDWDDGNFQEYPEQKGQNVVFEKFLFNPNTVSFDDLKLLGFKTYLAERLLKFRNAGGKFYIKSDIAKVYGISPEFTVELMPYIDLPNNRELKDSQNYSKHFVDKKYAPQLIDINTADTLTLKNLIGIGSKLSQRIVSFREKLGGFYSLDQLNEIYGLKPEVFNEIKPRLKQELSPLRYININTASKEELSYHPYIKRNLAEIIVNYRNQHGKFDSINDLLKIKVLDENIFLKLKNYLKV